VLLLPYLLSLLLSFSCNDSGLLPMGVEAFVGQPAAALLQQVGPSSAAACSRAKSALAMSAPPISSSPLKEREEEGAAATGVTPLNRSIVGFLKGGLSALYGDRHFARFYALETSESFLLFPLLGAGSITLLLTLLPSSLAPTRPTAVARVPYFSYTSCLHLMETCGMVRRAEFMRTHFMETYNELHHLIIMEELGGDERFIDRFIAQHLAVGYFWLAVALYLTNPTNAYNLNQCVEEHAYSTYDSFLKTHGEELKLRPPTQTSLDYYLR
jgi:hypothetical protein